MQDNIQKAFLKARSDFKRTTQRIRDSDFGAILISIGAPLAALAIAGYLPIYFIQRDSVKAHAQYEKELAAEKARSEKSLKYFDLGFLAKDEAFSTALSKDGLKAGQAFVKCNQDLCFGVFVKSVYDQGESGFAITKKGGRELEKAKADQISDGESYFINATPRATTPMVTDYSYKKHVYPTPSPTPEPEYKCTTTMRFMPVSTGKSIGVIPFPVRSCGYN